MKKEYISPEFNAVRFNSEDIICTSTEQITVTDIPKTTFANAAVVADQQIDVFGK